MPKLHNEAWFLKQEARLQEPINNTKRYYYKRFIIKIATVVLSPWGISGLLKTRKYLNSFMRLHTDFMNKGRAITQDGAPGAGKTFTGSNIAYFLAIEQWERLKSDYFTQRTMVTQWVKDGDADKLTNFKALEESYIFYKEREATNIPCLVSSIPLREYGTGRMSYVLPPEVFLQIDRVPEYTVLFNDESGFLQGADTSKTANKDILAFWRYPRHFFDGIFVNTNQDGSQNAIYMRRSTDFVNHLYGQEWLLRPVRLEKKYKRKEERYYKRLNRGKLTAEQKEYKGQELYYLKKYIATIGFRRIESRMTTSKGEVVGEIEETILPAIGGVQYDDRAYRNLYKCKDKEITLKGWERLVIDKFDRDGFDKSVSNEGGAA